jgi:very-short-patch-repair endonuclease
MFIMDPLLVCTEVAAGQYGVISRRQAVATGTTPRQIDRCLASGIWRVELPATYVLAASPRTWRQRAKAAELWAGPRSALTHSSAALVWGFEGFSFGPIEVASDRRLRSKEVVLHHHATWDAGRFQTKDGLRVTTVDQAIADLAGGMDSSHLEVVVDEALRRRLTSLGRIGSFLENQEGAIRGIARLREVLSVRQDGAPAESALEAALDRLLRNSILPPCVRQYRITRAGRFIARVDFAWPSYRVAIEAQGRTHHADKTSFERDLTRMNALSDAEWTVLYVTWDDVHRRPRRSLELFERTLRRSGWSGETRAARF